MARRRYSSTAVDTALTSSIGAGDTSLTVNDDTGFPAVPFVIVIDPDTASEELILVNTRAGNIFSSVTRSYDGTSAVGHSASAVVKHVASAADFDEVWTHTHATGDGHAAVPHANLSGLTTDNHHAQSHAHNGADGSGTVAHSATTGKTANDHHAQLHAAAHKAGGGDDLGFDLQGAIGTRPAAGTAGRLFFDTGNNVLYRDNGATWDHIDATQLVFANKGELLVGLSAGSAQLLAVGANGRVLTANSSPSAGVAWEPPVKTLTLPAGSFVANVGTPLQTNVSAGGIACWKLDSTTDESIFSSTYLPDEWDSAEVFVWHINDTAGSGNIRFQLFYRVADSGEDVSPGLTNVDTVIAVGSQHILTRTSVGTLTAPVVGTRELIFLEAYRDANHANDTFASDWAIVAVELVWAA